MTVRLADGSEKTQDIRARDWTSFRHLGGAGLTVLYIANKVATQAANATVLTAHAEKLFAFPMIAPARGGIIDLVQINVTSAASAGGLLILGIYDNIVTGEMQAGRTLSPGNLVAESAQIATTSTGVKSWSVRLELSPGALFWMALVHNSVATMPQLRNVAQGTASQILGSTEDTGAMRSTPSRGLYQSHTFGALPSVFSTTPIRVESEMPSHLAIAMRFAQ